ncbi:trigger factor [Thermodesulfobacteriota bacterium]
MKTSIEDISSVKKKLLIEIEANEVDKKLDQAYKTLSKKAKVPGFRSGKIPRSILERNFSTQVEDDLARELINESFPEAVNEIGNFPLGAPLLEKESLKKGQPFKYNAIMEVRPQFEVEDYLEVKAEKEIFKLDEKEVEKQLEQIRESNGKLNSVSEKRAIASGDFALLEYQGFEDGKPLEGISASNFLLKVGSGNFHQTFEESLMGMNKGDEKEIRVDFEETYYHSKLAGKTIDFKVKVEDIKEMELPDLDDNFATGLSSEFKNLEDLQNKVRETIALQEEKRIDSDLKQKILGSIAEKIDIELPETLVEAEINFALENIKQNFARSGSSIEKAGLSEDKVKEDFRPAAEKRVKHMLILGQIARQADLSVSEEDLEEGYKNLASSMGQEPETIKKYYEARNLVGSLEENLLEEKTLNYLVEHAKISEIDKNKLNKEKSKEESE